LDAKAVVSPAFVDSHSSTIHISYVHIFIYNILGFVRLWSCFPSICPVICPIIHPSKFLIPEEEDDGRGGGQRMAAGAVYEKLL
jgi:hypothetical protein